MSTQFLHRKESVILTAIEIIDELGVQGLSTREIAKRQGISEGTLFRHFKNKNEIVLAVLDYFSQYDQDIFATIRNKDQTTTRSIMDMFDMYVTYYESYPAIIAVTQLSVLLKEQEILDKIESINDSRQRFLNELILRAQKNGEISTMVSDEMLSDIIIGTFRIKCSKWRNRKQDYSLKEEILVSIQVLLQAFDGSRLLNGEAETNETNSNC